MLIRSDLVSSDSNTVPLDRLVLETDSPYMTPRPLKGICCHSGHIPLIAMKIAELKKIPIEKVIEATRENTKKLFGI